jgi:hypothetical protein
MKELSIQDLKSINEASGAPMISIYLSRENGMLDARTLHDKWKEALLKAEGLLLKDYTRMYANSLLDPLIKSNIFSQSETVDKGIVVFYGPKFQGYLRVQSAIEDLVVVADSFHIKPLLRIRNNEKGFYILSMSLKNIILYIEKNGHLYKLENYHNPALEENIEVTTNKYPRVHSKEFFMQVATELNNYFSINHQLPIILAGVKDHIGHMRKHLQTTGVLTEAIFGNVEKLKLNELREKAYKLLTPYYEQKEVEAINDLNLAVKKNHAVIYIEDIAVSAALGKVKKLFVVENRHIWGKVNRLTGEVYISPRQNNSHDDDILDDLSQIVFAKGGDVVVLKDAETVKGYIAAAIVTDRSHLYDYGQSFSY